MAKEWAKSFYKSKAWLQCRAAFIISVYGLCNRCQGPGYILHHVIELTPTNIKDPEISLNWMHLEYLCLDWHNKETFSNHDDVLRDGLIFNSKGEVIKVG